VVKNTLKLTFQNVCKAKNAPAAAQVRVWAALACQFPAELTVRIVDADEGRALNQSYRGKDYATNVLTFDYSHQPVTQADIVLCAPVVEAEAITLNKPLAEHWAHLVIHGCLHAQGYEHETHAKDALEMEALEAWLMMGGLGLPNPYG
jgi:probable rRNA maturation factor